MEFLVVDNYQRPTNRMDRCLSAIIRYLSDTFLIPFCNLGLQKGIR